MTTVLLILLALVVAIVAAALAMLVRVQRALERHALASAARAVAAREAQAAVVAAVSAAHDRHTHLLQTANSQLTAVAAAVAVVDELLRVDGSMLGKTVVLERQGHEVPNVRGVVIAEHEDRYTLDQAQAVTSNGPVPLEHPIIHVDRANVLSVSEVG